MTIFVVSLSASCIKTADQVKREKRFENMSEQFQDYQSLTSNVVTQMKDLQAQMDKMNGRIEELEHKQKQFNLESVKGTSETLALLEGQRQADSAQLAEIQKELKDQRAFLEKVTASLSSLGQSRHPQSSGKQKKKSPREEIADALSLIKSNDYNEARSQLLDLLDDKELTLGDQNKVLHGLGQVEYLSKNYDKALVYFSKIYSKFPKASLAPSSLLFIGKSLKSMGKKDEAKEAFAKLREDYPGAKETKEANEASKEL